MKRATKIKELRRDVAYRVDLATVWVVAMLLLGLPLLAAGWGFGIHGMRAVGLALSIVGALLSFDDAVRIYKSIRWHRELRARYSDTELRESSGYP